MRRAWIAGLLLFAVSLSMNTPAAGQDAAKKPLDVSYITDDFFAAIVVHPARVLKAPALEGLPIEQGLAMVKQMTGLDLKQVEQIILLLPPPEKWIFEGVVDEAHQHPGEKDFPKFPERDFPKEKFEKFPFDPPKGGFEKGDPGQPPFDPPRGKEAENPPSEPPPCEPPQRPQEEFSPVVFQREFNGHFHRHVQRDVVPIGVIVRFNQPVAGKELLLRAAQPLGVKELEELVHGKRRGTYFRPKNRLPLGAHVPDERTIVLAEEETLKRMMEAEKVDSPLVRRLSEASAADDFTAVVVMDPLRQSVAQLKQELERHRFHGEEVFLLTLVQELLKHVDSYSAAGNLHKSLSARYEIQSPNEKSAEIVQDLFRGYMAALKVFTPAIEQQLARETRRSSGSEAEIIRRMMGVLKQMADSVEIKRDGRRVLLRLELGDEYPKLLATMISLVGEIRVKEREQEAINNLRQLGIAFHNYHDTHNRFPAQGGYDNNGKPLLSWRVHLLPFMEDGNLYRQFRLDEPWDSPHNKKLIARMPEVFKSPGRDLPPGKTCFMTPVSKQGRVRPKYATIIPQGPPQPGRANKWGEGHTRMASVTDGTSNTILLVEAAPGSAVIWTKPDDWEFNAAKPRAGLFGMRKGYVLTLFCDASFRRISEKVSDATLRRAIGRADGEFYDDDEFRGGERPRRFGDKVKEVAPIPLEKEDNGAKSADPSPPSDKEKE